MIPRRSCQFRVGTPIALGCSRVIVGVAAALLALKRPLDALESSDRAIGLRPADAAGHANRGAGDAEPGTASRGPGEL